MSVEIFRKKPPGAPALYKLVLRLPVCLSPAGFHGICADLVVDNNYTDNKMIALHCCILGQSRCT